MTITIEVKHTPGPWIVDEDMSNDVMAGGELLATAYPMKRDDLPGSWKANAALIAAAPELLEALKALLDVAPLAETVSCGQIHLQAKAAIRKAEGAA